MRSKQIVNGLHRISRMSWKRRVLLGGLIASMTVSLFGSCVENEISFFVEHVKVQPKTPACAYSESDEVAADGTLDLIFGNGFSNGYQLRNQLMSREDYDNLKAENGGLFIDSYEVSLRTAATNQELGFSQRLPREYHMEPESTDVIVAEVLPPDIAWQLAEENHCLPLRQVNYPPENLFPTDPTLYSTDADGNLVPRTIGVVNSRIQFFGHSQGGDSLETQVYTFPITLCCGCLVEWGLCKDPCERYCTEYKDLDEPKMCVPGVANGDDLYDCREKYLNTSMVWECPMVNTDEETMGESPIVTGACSCATSCK